MHIKKSSVGAFIACFYMASLGALPSGISNLALLLTVTIAIHAFVYLPRYMRVRLLISMGLVFLVVSASVIVAHRNSLDVLRSAEYAARLLLPFLFFTIGASAGSRSGAFFCIQLILAVVASHVLFAGIGAVIGSAPVIGGVVRPAGFLTPNVVANTALVGAGICLALWMNRSDLPSRLPAVTPAILLVLLAFLIIGATLKNILALIPCVLITHWISVRKQRVPKIAVILIAAGPLLALAVLGSPLLDRILEVYQDLKSGGGSSSLFWRIEHWRLLLDQWISEYFWTGAGIGQSLNMWGVRSVYGEGAVAHSDWIGLTVELGAILCPILVATFGYFWWGAYSLLSSVWQRACAAGVLVSLVVAMAGGNVVFTVAFLYLYWLMLGAFYGDSIRLKADFRGANV